MITTSRAARPQTAGGGLEKAIEPVELPVDPDPERLERARRRIDPHESAARNRASHDRREPPGGVDRRLTARVNDGARDAPREPLFAELKDRIRQLDLARSRQQVGGRLAAASVHSHVERLVALKAEAAARSLELHRRHAEVGQRAVDEGDAEPVEHVVERAVIGVHELDAIGATAPTSRARGPARRGRDRGR